MRHSMKDFLLEVSVMEEVYGSGLAKGCTIVNSLMMNHMVKVYGIATKSSSQAPTRGTFFKILSLDMVNG